MSLAHPVESKASAQTAAHLLESIRDLQTRVGDGLSDDELTRLIEQSALPPELGFAFLSYGDRFVTLSVPSQNLADWYPDAGWIAEKQDGLARKIAAKYGLRLYEPPDAKHLMADSANRHHHLELGNNWETVIMIHPQYLKIRLSGAPTVSASAEGALKPLFVGVDLLHDLAGFYQA